LGKGRRKKKGEIVPWISELTSEKGIKDYWICMYSDFERGIKDYPEFVKLNGSMKAQTHSFFFFFRN
jgi:hypothetical protein